MRVPCISENGFTLVELLVALFIFGLLSAAGTALLTFSIDGQNASREALADMSAIRRMNASLTNDLTQAARRPARDEVGFRQSAFFGSDGREGNILFSIVRRGWNNYDGEARSSLQKVDYLLVEDRLERRAYPYVDGAEPLPAAILVEGVEDISLRYRINGELRDRWDPARLDLLPDAVELTVTIEGLGPVRQLLLVGGGGG